MPTSCNTNCGRNAILKRPKTGDALCKECFYWAFEEEIHHTIITASLFTQNDYVAIAASGGKDSTVLAHIMKLLNERYNYGLKLVLLSVDEGITGYRDDSLETVKRNEKQYDIPLKILSYEELYGWTMDKIVEKVGRKNNCTFCGVFRRQALDRGAAILKVDKIVTGHNADDIAETVIMNILRGDIARLQRCTAIQTSSEGTISRSKPFKYAYEKEIVMYAYFKKLDYFSTECIYSPNAYRGHARAFLKDLERIRPSAIIDVIHSGECLAIRDGVRLPTQGFCTKCGHVSSQTICKACILLEGLNKGKPRLGIGKSSKVKDALELLACEQKDHTLQGEATESNEDKNSNAKEASASKEGIKNSSKENVTKDSTKDVNKGNANKESTQDLDKKKENFSKDEIELEGKEEQCENCCKNVGGSCSKKLSQIEDIGSSFTRPNSGKKGKVIISESIRNKLKPNNLNKAEEKTDLSF